MARSDRVVRRIDERNDNIKTGGGNLIQIGSAAPTQGGVIQPPEPTNITIGTQVLLRTTYTPKIAVNVSWGAPPNLLPEFYLVEYAESSDFTTNVIRVTTSLNRIALEMKPDTDYWVRVKAMIRNIYSAWGYPANYPSVSVHTIGDTTPPNAVSGVTANWTTGDLILKWTNPTSSNFFRTRVRIYNTFGGTLFKEVMIVGNPGATSEYRFTVDENYEVTSNNPLTSVYYELLAYSIAGVPAVSAVTGNITKAKPSIPTGLSSSWSGDDGTYDEGVTFSWSAVVGASIYRIVIDGTIKETPRTQYNYSYSENVSDHRPTLVSGDFSLGFTVQAKDALGQISPGASGTATNLAPSASNIALTTVPGFSSLYAYVTPTTEILDLYAYNWTLKSGGVNVRNVVSFTPEVTFTTLNGAYILEVYAQDKFGRKSTTISGTATLDGLTIEQLRAETQYTNSLGTNPTTLAGLKNNDLLTSVVTIASGTAWQWHLAQRPLLDRFRTVTVAFSGAATNMPRVYFAFSNDDTTYTYFSGPLVATGSTGQNTTLTSYGSSEANAQTNAVLATNINRYDLPSIIEARFVKMGHRGNIHHITEYYPRRLVQSDDMEAENIKAINIAAAAVTADKISVINLQAVSAQMGALHMDGIIDITTAGGIYQGTGSFASPTTGLKIYNTGGIGRFTLYSGGIAQVDATTNGILTAGAGNVRLTSSGISLLAIKSDNEAITSYPQFQISWVDRDVTTRKVGAITGDIALGFQTTHFLKLYSHSPSSTRDSVVMIFADSASHAGVDAPTITISNLNDFTLRQIDITAANDIFITAGNNVKINDGGLNVGSPSVNAITGQIWASNTIGSLGSSAGLIFEDRSTGDDWQWFASGDNGNLWNSARTVFQIGGAGSVASLYEDSGTNNIITQLTLQRATSGTAAVGFGNQITFNLEASAGSVRNAGAIQVVWTNATDTTRASEMRFFGYDGNGATTNAREFFRGGSTGSAAALGFFGTAVQAKKTVTGSRGGNAALASLLTQLAGYGLLTDSSTA